MSKKSYFEITYATIVKISEEVKVKEELEKILLCDVQIKICPDIEKSFLNLLHDSGYPGFQFEKKLDFQNSKNKLISNVTAKEISNKEELKTLLIEQIEKRVRWRESIINMIDNGVNHFIEIGPGKALTGMVKRTIKNANCFSINSIADIKNLQNEFKK